MSAFFLVLSSHTVYSFDNLHLLIIKGGKHKRVAVTTARELASLSLACQTKL